MSMDVQGAGSCKYKEALSRSKASQRVGDKGETEG